MLAFDLVEAKNIFCSLEQFRLDHTEHVTSFKFLYKKKSQNNSILLKKK